MAAVAPAPDAFAVVIPATSGGIASYSLAAGTSWTIQSLSWQVDLSGGSGPDDVWVRILDQSGLLICGQVPGAAQAAGSIVAYSIAPNLNPCDGITVSASLALVPDTFTAITLVDNCSINIEARNSTTGAIDTSAVIGEAVAWVTGAGTPAGPDLTPIYLPVPSLAGASF